MKKSWLAVIMLAALSALASGAYKVSAQQVVPIAGGYAEASRNDPEVVSAARYATRAQQRKQRALISLVRIEGAEVQVVAGLNYRLRLRVKVKGRAENVTAVVYKNLKQRYSLTSWEAGTDAVESGPAAPIPTVEELMKTFADAYEAKSLGTLDASPPYYGSVKIVMTYALSERGDTGTTVRRFSTLAKAERWLRSREISEDLPHRHAMPLEKCSKGVCSFDFSNGILHNQMYLQEITYGMRNGRPYIKTISLWESD